MSAWSALLFFCHPAVAFESPLLGPEGVFWVGTLHPQSPATLSREREWVRVNPRSGDLWVEHTDFQQSRGAPIDLRRFYRNGDWHYSFEHGLKEEERQVIFHHAGETHRLIKNPSQYAGILVGQTLRNDHIQLTRSEEGWLVETEQAQLHFNDQGELLSKETPTQQSVRFEWKEGLLQRIDTASGPSLHLKYNAQGRVSVIRNNEDKSCFYEYRGGDQLIGFACTDRERTRYVYDTESRLRSLHWADGSSLQVQRESSGKVSALHGPGMEYQRYKWGPDRLQIQESTGAGTTLQWEDEGYQITGPRGRQVRVLLKDNRVVGWTNPAGGITRVQRDDALRPTRIDTPEGGYWSLKWRGQHLQRIQNPAGAAWTYRHNSQGHLVSMEDADGLERSFERSSTGKIRSLGLASGKTLLQRDSAGRLTGIQSPSGATTRVERNSRGHITAFVDPSGQRILLSRSPSGRLTSITERTGEKWEFSSDALGRVSGFETPSGGEIRWSRNSLGQIEEMQAGDERHLRFKHNGAGMPTQVVSSSGRERRFEWDPTGQLRRIRLEDGTEMRLQRDPLNRLAKIQYGTTEFSIVRNANGRPLSVGPLTFKWLGGEHWQEARAPGFQLSLERGTGGRIRSVVIGDHNSRLQYDSSGRWVGLGSGEAAITAQRDANGFITKLTRETENTLFQRDVRGLLTETRHGEMSIRSQYDAAGRLLKNQLAGGPGLSAQYDSEGRLALLRFPSGSITRFGKGPSSRMLLLEDPSGRQLLNRQLSYNSHGELSQSQEGESRRTFHRDLRGRLVNVEERGQAWSWIPRAIEGPNDLLIELNESGRPLRARLPIGSEAYGGLASQAQYTIIEGAIESIQTESARQSFLLDALGRPTQVRQDNGSLFLIEWDLLGNVKAIHGPTGSTKPLFGLQGPIGLQDTSQLQALLRVKDAGVVQTGETAREWMRDELGRDRYVREDTAKQAIQASPLNTSTHGLSALLPSAHWPLAAAELGLGPQGGVDQISGQSLQNIWTPPWRNNKAEPDPWPRIDGSAMPWWAPDPWMQSSIWEDPIGLLEQLETPTTTPQDNWTLLFETPPALGWLPPSAASAQPPVGPPRGAIPADLSALEALCLQAAMGPIFPLKSRSIGHTLFAQETLHLPELNWLSQKGRHWWLMDSEHWLELP